MKLSFKQTLAAISSLYCLALAPASLAAESRPIAVIVSSTPEIAVIQQLPAHDLSLIYWRKKQYWQDGVRIHPVNLHSAHPLRIHFSKTVLGSLPNEQADYWNGLYFHGINPPYSLQSEEAVLRYVNSTKGAIGYVDACKVDDRVRPLLWVTDSAISPSKPALNCEP